jgi:hypothetical protein
VVAEVPVGLAHPRDADVRLSEAFLDIRREVETALGAGRS